MELIEETRRVEGDQIIVNRTFKMEKPIEFIHMNFVVGCANEDSHDFDSTGRCRMCGAHRRPA